ncbi:hypothetical protein Pint_06742 [Pistacia integerrima]|uniref:Uncharacterized protein n=1 Tax=Pistacia integerrima TaxID=434235 RepID=A0ACC0XWN9_9ROSI|nr:hypothetical protein Pint_06742 [Pistacia integerrima]
MSSDCALICGGFIKDELKQSKAGFILVLSAHFRAYKQAFEKLQLDIAIYSNLIGVESGSTSLFSRGRQPLKNRLLLLLWGNRINILRFNFTYCEYCLP